MTLDQHRSKISQCNEIWDEKLGLSYKAHKKKFDDYQVEINRVLIEEERMRACTKNVGEVVQKCLKRAADKQSCITGLEKLIDEIFESRTQVLAA